MGQVIGHSTSLTFANTTEGKTHELGAISETHDGKRFMFVKAAEAISQYDAVAVDESANASQLTKTEADDSWKIGVAQVAIASGSYGWVQIYGPTTVNVINKPAADAVLYTSATAGALDDSATSQTKIAGVVVTTVAGTTAATSAAALMAIEPFVDR